MTRRCPFTGCERLIDSGRFACPAHWFRLTRTQQRRIYYIWDRYLAGEMSGEQLRVEQEKVIKEVEQR